MEGELESGVNAGFHTEFFFGEGQKRSHKVTHANT